MILWIPVEQIEPHPMNSNVMPQKAMAKLARHLKRTGQYEPLIVRPIDDPVSPPQGKPATGPQVVALSDSQVVALSDPPPQAFTPPAGEALAPSGHRYQLLNGHHRCAILRQLGQPCVRCDVWQVSDEEALLLLATLNRLQGDDEPMKRARLLEALSAARADQEEALSRLAGELPEDRAALDRALALASVPLPAPLSPAEVSLELRQAVTFFLDENELATLNRALRRTAAPRPGQSAAAEHGRKRAVALMRLAESYLEFVEGDEP